MARDKDIFGELRQLIAAFEGHMRTSGQTGLKTQVKGLKAWSRRLALYGPPDRLTEQNAELILRLKQSKQSFDTTVGAYRDLLDSFDIFRKSIDLILQLKRLDELPRTIDAVREVRHLHSMHIVLDAEIFSGRVPPDIPLAAPQELRERLIPFSPTPHAPRMFLGESADMHDPQFFLGRDIRHGSAFLFALRHKYLHGRIIGTVAAYDPDPKRFAQDKATDFLGHFCDILADTLVTALEHTQLEELTVRDMLTGLNNRTYLERHAPRILDFATRKGLPVHLLFLDLNGFKAINDQLGHEAGDLILIAVGQAIRSMVRRYDIFVRLGGDEFVILLPDTTAATANVFVQRLRGTLAGLDPGTICGRETKLRISASIGVAPFTPPQTLDELLRTADHRMYEDKSARNTVRSPHKVSS